MARQGSGQIGAEIGSAEASEIDPLIGTTLGAFELVSRIGAGDIGVVYRAQHRLLGWHRALKLLPLQPSDRVAGTAGVDDDRDRDGVDDDRDRDGTDDAGGDGTDDAGGDGTDDWSRRDNRAFVDRFIEVVKHAAYLRHPSIVQIQDIGIDERYCFVVMELLEGPSLASLLASGARLPIPRCVALLGQLAGALDYAHDANVPHEDLTPSRIIVRTGDHPTLLDFGVARLRSPDHLSPANARIGTPAYLAPESIGGVGGGYTADQYALGVLAYELIVGRRPFVGGGAEGSDDDDALIEAHLHQEPPAPRELRPELTEAIEKVLLRQLAKEPGDRHTTATEFVSALRAAMEIRPARPEGVTPRITGPRPPDPWTSLQAELQEKHRSQQKVQQAPPARLPRRAFLATAGTVAVAGTVAAGWTVWSQVKSRWPRQTDQAAEPITGAASPEPQPPAQPNIARP